MKLFDSNVFLNEHYKIRSFNKNGLSDYLHLSHSKYYYIILKIFITNIFCRQVKWIHKAYNRCYTSKFQRNWYSNLSRFCNTWSDKRLCVVFLAYSPQSLNITISPFKHLRFYELWYTLSSYQILENCLCTCMRTLVFGSVPAMLYIRSGQEIELYLIIAKWWNTW